jgi:hypothetical protein
LVIVPRISSIPAAPTQRLANYCVIAARTAEDRCGAPVMSMMCTSWHFGPAEEASTF